MQRRNLLTRAAEIAGILACLVALITFLVDENIRAAFFGPGLEPTPVSTPTLPPTPTTTPGLVYDDFAGDCIHAYRWPYLLDSGYADGEEPLPVPPSGCWELADRGIFSTGDRLRLESLSSGVTYMLANWQTPPVRALQMDATVEGGSGGWRNIGLFTRLSTGNRDWAYYYLNVDGPPDAARATVTYTDGLHPLQTVDLGPVQMPAKYILRIQWDGEKMSFLVNGRPYLTSIDYPGYTDTFGIQWATGSGSTFKGAVDNFIVEWK